MSTEGSVKWKHTTSTKVVGSVLYHLVITITLQVCVCMLLENMHLNHQTIPPMVQKWDREYSVLVTLAQWLLPCEW